MSCSVGGRVREGFGAESPDGGDPGQAGVVVPEGGDVMPGAGADAGFDGGACLEGEEGGVADEEGGVVVGEHGGDVGGGGGEGGVGVVEAREDELGVGDGAAGGGVGGDGADGGEGVGGFDDELDGADLGERGDGSSRARWRVAG